MRILHVITSLKGGGTEAQLYDLLTYFKQNPNNQHFVAYFRHGPVVDDIAKLGIPVYHIKGILSGDQPDPLLYIRVKKLAKELKVDLIHSALWSADIVSRLAGRSLGIPVMSDIHTDASYRNWFRNWLDAKTAPFAQRIIAVGNVSRISYEKDVVPKIAQGAKQEHVLHNLGVVFNGIEIDRTMHEGLDNKLTRKEFGLDDTDFVFGSCGRVARAKGNDLLIKAFADLCKSIESNKLYNSPNVLRPNPKLLIVGGGSVLQELKDLTKSLGIADKVIFTGWRTDAKRFYPLFDCYALASFNEALSIALLDAMCFGLPVISTQRWGFHDVIESGKNGILVPLHNIEALTKAMETIYTDQVAARKIGELNANHVREHFTMDRKAHQFQVLFAEVVKRYQIKTKAF